MWVCTWRNAGRSRGRTRYIVSPLDAPDKDTLIRRTHKPTPHQELIQQIKQINSQVVSTMEKEIIVARECRHIELSVGSTWLLSGLLALDFVNRPCSKSSSFVRTF